jgi:hypothetical protein
MKHGLGRGRIDHSAHGMSVGSGGRCGGETGEMRRSDQPGLLIPRLVLHT